MKLDVHKICTLFITMPRFQNVTIKETQKFYNYYQKVLHKPYSFFLPGSNNKRSMGHTAHLNKSSCNILFQNVFKCVKNSPLFQDYTIYLRTYYKAYFLGHHIQDILRSILCKNRNCIKRFCIVTDFLYTANNDTYRCYK